MKTLHKKILLAAFLLILLCFVLYFVPFPQKIKAELPAIKLQDPDSIPYTLSIDAWKLNYLFQHNAITGVFSLSSQNDTLFQEDVQYKTPVLTFPSTDQQNSAEYFVFSVYDKQSNRYVPASINTIAKKPYYVLSWQDSKYIAPAESQENAGEIYNMFDQYL